jgi:hypothetical protein
MAARMGKYNVKKNLLEWCKQTVTVGEQWRQQTGSFQLMDRQSGREMAWLSVLSVELHRVNSSEVEMCLTYLRYTSTVTFSVCMNLGYSETSYPARHMPSREEYYGRI